MNDRYVELVLTQLGGNISAFEAMKHHVTLIAEMGTLIAASLSEGRKVLICGNGGSAADSQHFAAELVGRFVTERRALPAIALSTDTSVLTSIGNDYGFERVFARQVEALGLPGDVLVAITTSGNSPNVLAAVRSARERHMPVIGLTGAKGGTLPTLSDLCFEAPSMVTAHIQETHIFVIHCICSILDRHFSPSSGVEQN